MENEKNKKGQASPADLYPGVAVDHSDDNRETPELVDERTDILDNNPRIDNGIDNGPA